MSAEYRPGTVAEIRPLNSNSWTRAIRQRNGEWSSAQFGHFLDDEVADIRPLVVLDLDGHDRDKAVRCIRFVEKAHKGADHGDLVSLIADQIEAQTKPPRIPEPGLWGVVEADTKGKSGSGEHVNIGAGWLATSDGKVRTWDALIDPTLIREGLS